MKLYVARHGKTNYNDLGLCNGDPKVDVHLTETGEMQARLLAQKMEKTTLDQIFVSELKRTQQTAKIVNEYHNIAIVVDARLNDNRTGFEGKHFSEYLTALDQAKDKWTARFNDGESVEDINSRIRSFMNELKTLSSTAVLIITSEVIVQAIYGVLSGTSNEEARALQVEQGSFIEFDL
jgi:broad specificity phosphatase PhoE